MEEKGLEKAVTTELEIMPIAALKRQFEALHELMSSFLQEGTDYGKIPGVSKPSLWKPGAEKIVTYFRLDPQFETLRVVLDEDFVLYDVKCTIFSINTGRRLGSGTGSCNSREEKYHWRKAIQQEYDAESPDRRRMKIRKSGSGTYQEMQTRAEPYDYLNTIEKMAAKRALVAAVLVTTAASAIFTQDVEDLPDKPSESTGNGEDTTKMVRLLHVLLRKTGITESKDKYEFAQNALALKEVKSLDSLTWDQCRKLIDILNETIRRMEEGK